MSVIRQTTIFKALLVVVMVSLHYEFILTPLQVVYSYSLVESTTLCVCLEHARNYRLIGTETQQIFSRMFVMAKKIKELFTSTLNGIPASVRGVSSIIVVLNAKLT